MNSCFLLIAVLFPIVCGAVILPGRMEDRKKLYRYVGAVTLITSALTWMLILFCKTDAFTVLKLTEDLSFALRNRSHAFLQNKVSRRIDDFSSALYF